MSIHLILTETQARRLRQHLNTEPSPSGEGWYPVVQLLDDAIERNATHCECGHVYSLELTDEYNHRMTCPHAAEPSDGGVFEHLGDEKGPSV